MTPTAANSPAPHHGRLRARTPATMARTSTVTITEATTTYFAEVPKVAVAHSLTGAGGMSMAEEATTCTGPYAASWRAATKVPTAMPKPAETRPISAKTVLRDLIVGSVGRSHPRDPTPARPWSECEIPGESCRSEKCGLMGHVGPQPPAQHEDARPGGIDLRVGLIDQQVDPVDTCIRDVNGPRHVRRWR